jgi:hypothetical protein
MIQQKYCCGSAVKRLLIKSKDEVYQYVGHNVLKKIFRLAPAISIPFDQVISK